MFRRPASIVALLYFTIGGGLDFAYAQSEQAGAPSLLKQMAGTWDVQQRMWQAPGAKAVELPAARAERRLVGTTFLDEVMELAPGSNEQAFTRHAVFNYNAVNRQYEYFSIDTRGPQMMMEKTGERSGPGSTKSAIKLQGGSFMAPQWGEAKEVAFRYRLEVGPIENDRQAVRLYFTPLSRLHLTPLSGEKGREFLAFEYVYTRRQ